MHPAYRGLAALPYYDEFDLSTVDVLLISQYVTSRSFPEDYCASLAIDLYTVRGRHFLVLSNGRLRHIGGGLLLQASFETKPLLFTCLQKSSYHVHQTNQYHHDQRRRAQAAVFAVT